MGHGEDGAPEAEETIEELERELGDILTSISLKLEAGEESEMQYKQWLGTLAGLCQKSIDEFRISSSASEDRLRDRQSGEVASLAQVADLKAQLMSSEAEIRALQEQIGLGVRARANSDNRRQVERFEEDMEAVEAELQVAKDQIAELRTANMRLENENESLLDLEDRAAALTEETLRQQAELSKLNALKGLEEEHDNTVRELENALAENEMLEESTKRLATQVDDCTAQYERCKKQLDEANEILTIKQNMVDALRETLEQQQQSSTQDAGLDLQAEVAQVEPQSVEFQGMRQRVTELEAKNSAAESELSRLHEKLAQHEKLSAEADEDPEEVAGREQLRLQELEEEFRTNSGRLLKGFGEVDQCIANLARAVERSENQMVKVGMEVRVATLAKETMAIQLRELFGPEDGSGLPELVVALQERLAGMIKQQRAAAAAPKPLLNLERLESFKQRHLQVMGSARSTVACLSSLLKH